MSPRHGRSDDNSPGSANANAVSKLRRAHRKSRNGCLECKRRHIKCDETRPACSNCVVGERDCQFPPGATANGSRTAQSENHSPTEANGNNSPSGESVIPQTLNGLFGHSKLHEDESLSQTLPYLTAAFTGSPSSFLDSYVQPAFTTKHLVLLHHAETEMDSFQLGSGLTKTVIDIAVTWAYEAPYVLDQVLALSADNMALRAPENAASHRRTATELQTRALEAFNQNQPGTLEESQRTCMPRFTFAVFLSMHVLFESLAYYRSSFNVFIDRFVESVCLHRGIRTVMESNMPLIQESVLRRFLLMDFTDEACRIPGSECVALARLIEGSDLGPQTVIDCMEAVRSLQWAFNLLKLMKGQGIARAAASFPVILTEGFIDALQKRRPEALVILAHYGVLLHRCRSSWLFGDAGAFLIHLIADYLGTFWQEPMRWPLEALENEQG